METLRPSNVGTTANERDAALRQIGFERTDDGWRRGGVLMREEGDWLVFETGWPDAADPLSDHVGKSGLWKPVRTSHHIRRIFTVPETLVRENQTPWCDEDRSPLEGVV